MTLAAVAPAAAPDLARAEAVWTDAMLAAALLAVDPGLGGAVVPRRRGSVRDAWLSTLRQLTPDGAPWRRLPPGLEDARLLGGLDLAAALGAGRRVLQRGLLAEADGGVVVAPMAERPARRRRRPPGRRPGGRAVTVERDGLAARLQTRFRARGAR
jgi:magnesium chelatase subunit D